MPEENRLKRMLGVNSSDLITTLHYGCLIEIPGYVKLCLQHQEGLPAFPFESNNRISPRIPALCFFHFWVFLLYSPSRIFEAGSNLRDLAVLRMISKRRVSVAKTISASMPSPLFQKHGGDRTWRAQIERALTTFRELFPGCCIDPDLKLEDEMVSYRLYKIHHPTGGRRQAGKKLSQIAL